MNNKKPLYGCVLCRDCINKLAPISMGILTSKDMIILGWSGYSNNYLADADRKCLNFKSKE